MLPDVYLMALLNNPSETDFRYYKEIIDILSTGEKDDAVLEKEMLARFPSLENEKRVRSLVYKLEETSVIRNKKRKNEQDIRPIWSWILENNDEYLKRNAHEIQMQKVNELKERFLGNTFVFYCDALCTPKIYTYDQMVESGGRCPSCHAGSLLSMTDEQKKSTIVKYVVTKFPDFIDKKAVLADILSSVLPIEFSSGLELPGIAARHALVPPAPAIAVQSSIAEPRETIDPMFNVCPASENDILFLLSLIHQSPGNGELHLAYKPGHHVARQCEAVKIGVKSRGTSRRVTGTVH